jgi:Uncharacterised nucleotidyltransferase
MPEEVISARVAGALRERGGAMPPRREWRALVALAEEHGVLPLLAEAGAAGGWDRQLVRSLRAAVAGQVALSIVRERELRRVLGSLSEAGIEALLFKGSHLAFSLYPAPDRRPHVDTDLLVREGDRERVMRRLDSLGYEPGHQTTGEVAFGQRHYARIDESGARHTIDVHWRIANPLAFADRLTFADLVEEAVSVPRLGPRARGPSPKHALLIACLHRTAHHGGSRRLLWLYDIHLLAQTLAESDWSAVADMAIERDLGAVLVAGLDDTRAALSTDIPERVLTRLREHAGRADADVATFLAGPVSLLHVVVSDWRRLTGWRNRARFLREHLFPPVDYMKRKYDVSSNVFLPWLYAVRIVSGAGRAVRSPSTPPASERPAPPAPPQARRWRA